MKLLLKIKQFQTIQLSMNQKFIAIKYLIRLIKKDKENLISR